MRILYCVLVMLLICSYDGYAQDEPTIQLPATQLKSRTALKESEKNTAILDVVVNRAGIIQSVDLIQASEDADNDAMAVNSIRKLGHIKPIPDNVMPNKQFFKIQFPINFVK